MSKRTGSKFVIVYYPTISNARSLDAVMFMPIPAEEEIKRLAKIAGRQDTHAGAN